MTVDLGRESSPPARAAGGLRQIKHGSYCSRRSAKLKAVSFFCISRWELLGINNITGLANWCVSITETHLCSPTGVAALQQLQSESPVQLFE